MYKTPSGSVPKLVDYEVTPCSSGTTTPISNGQQNGLSTSAPVTPLRRPSRSDDNQNSDDFQTPSSQPFIGPVRPKPTVVDEIPVGRPSPAKLAKKLTVRKLPTNVVKPMVAEPSPILKQNFLPVEEHKDKIIGVIYDNQTTILIGETGSGKSTIIPQYIIDHITIPSEQVAVTQPRRVAAYSLASMVARQRGVTLGEEVNKEQYANDPSLSQYACIVLDEVHERSMASDVLMYVIRKIQKERTKPLKLVLMSATMNAEKLQTYFGNAPAFLIPGRSYPVNLLHADVDVETFQRDEYCDMTLEAVSQLHQECPLDFLVFLTGQEEIEFVCRAIMKENSTTERPIRVVPFYAQVRNDDVQKAVFEVQTGNRKIVVATNIAETSITIPDVRVVIDCGKVKQKPVSKAQAIQRAGRAGRTSTGKCFRLYSKDVYDKMSEATTPEIRRSNLSEVLMNLITVGIRTPRQIDLLDNPTEREWCTALDELYILELIDFQVYPGVFQIQRHSFVRTDVTKKLSLEYKLTELGEKIRRLPVSPIFGRFLATCHKHHCLTEGLIVAACCSVDDILVRPDYLDKKTQEEQKVMLGACHVMDNDHGRIVKIFRHYKRQTTQFGRQWCEKSGINYHRLEEAKQIRQQLRDECAKVKMDQEDDQKAGGILDVYARLKLAITESFFLNAVVLFVNQSFPQQPEVLNPLCLTYQNPAWPENQINEHNVLSYFCDPNNTHFYERTSDNEQLRMQANLFQGNPKDLETQLARMTGIQYVLHKSRPPLYVIRKQIRTITPLCYYYVLRGIVYQAPDLYSVVNSRIVDAAEPLKTALSNVVDMLQYNPTKGTYSWKFKSEPSKKKRRQERDGGNGN
ncbi:putative ATP-dependent RNA helicase DHX33 [Aphelenchoides besseyi]|nr:putative ATP-dependent RNA helicase DHX33 [Aphelenchoides besseyi]